MPYCPRCGTPLSSHELAQGYKEGTKDPSVFVKFPLRDQPGHYLLVWTTTPWTLPGNVAVAVGEEIDYVLVEHEDDKLWLAEALVGKVFGSHAEHVKVLRRAKGRELLGWHYQPLYTFLPVTEDYCYVIPGDFVSTEDGTGLVHIAPAFGADDMEVGRKFDLPTLMTVDAQGRFIDAVGPWRGIFVKDADPLIQQELDRARADVQAGDLRAHLPVLLALRHAAALLCAHDLVHQDDGVQGALAGEQPADQLGARAHPGRPLRRVAGEQHRLGAGARALLGHAAAVLGLRQPGVRPPGVHRLGGRAEREDRSEVHEPALPGAAAEPLARSGPARQRAARPAPAGRGRADLALPEVRRDACAACREVADAWFDSGSMPVAQWHYPFENRELFTEQFPADYICEAIDQTRGWFYTLHAVSTLLFDQPSFKNVICLGHIVAEDGSKMSKSRGNIVNPWSVLDAHGADATRWYMYTASPPGNTRRFCANLVREVVGKFLLTLWNSYSFFVTYANLNDFDPAAPAVPLAERSVLDRWVLAKLNSLVENVTQALETYDVTGATRPIADFVDELSNWYVRLSRRRFWNTGEETGKQGNKETGSDDGSLSTSLPVYLSTDSLAAHQTMYEVLVTLSHLLAPFTPFIADEMYRNLVCCGMRVGSRHLALVANPQFAIRPSESLA